MSQDTFAPTRHKIRSQQEMAAFSTELKAMGKRVVYTNGCFDIMHPGHVTYLEHARSLGDALIVALNSDVSVRALKGPKRPILPEADRALLLAALGCVDCVTLFDEVRCTGVIELARPNVYVKGGDYTIATLDPGERAALEGCGAEIVFVPIVAGVSTTDIIARIIETECDAG
jgi:D-glycero-beta-D-manno-heptose 1-phosphate adenylyltransferase